MAVAAAVVLASCGGDGGTVETGVSLRPLSPEFSTRKSVNYSPFRSGNRDTEKITPEMIKQDLDLLLAGGFRLIRLFDSSDKVAKQTLQVIHEHKLDMKVMLGIWITGTDQTANNEEIARGVALANDKDFADIVLAVSVGNETLVSWTAYPVKADRLAEHIRKVRGQIKQPVTSDDNWAPYAGQRGEQDVRLVIDTIDFVSAHTYPLADTVPPAVPQWDWRQLGVPAGYGRATAMMAAAVAEAQRQFLAVRAHLDALGYKAMPIVIGETGWKAVASKGETYRAHPVNEKMYYDGLAAWRAAAGGSAVSPLNIFWFEAFDEPWKGDDDKWGLFTVERKARYVIQGLYPQSLWDEPGKYKDTDAVYAPDVLVVSANRYTVYSDVVTPGEVVAAGADWFGFDSPANAFAGDVPVAGGTGEGVQYKEVAPAPVNYGWGMLVASNSPVDLSAFAASGKLNFRIRTTYKGKLEVGYIGATGYATWTLSNTNADGYGFVSDGQWHSVSIPIAAMTVKSPPAAVDLTGVTQPFVISDRYGITGNNFSANPGDARAKIDVDAVYWSK